MAVEDPTKVGGRYPGVGYVLSSGGTRSDTFWFRYMGRVGGDEEDGVGNACRIPTEYHEEEGAEDHKWDMGNTGGWTGVVGVYDTDRSYLHRT